MIDLVLVLVIGLVLAIVLVPALVHQYSFRFIPMLCGVLPTGLL